MEFVFLFLGKVIDRILNTSKTILVQRNKGVLAGVLLGMSDFIYLAIIKNITAGSGILPMIVVAVAGGIGCWFAVKIADKFSKDKLFINIILSDDKEAIKAFSKYLREHDIANIVMDTYNRDMNRKTLSLTAYAETKNESHLISEYIKSSDCKFKRIVKT